MLLAELQIWHTRPLSPTRRLALGHLMLPTDPAPGLGGVLLAAVVAAYLPGVPDDLHADIARLIDQVTAGQRVVQPRLEFRYQVDRHGLATSVHQLTGDADHVEFDLHSMGKPLAQVLGAVYALERLDDHGEAPLAPDPIGHRTCVLSIVSGQFNRHRVGGDRLRQGAAAEISDVGDFERDQAFSYAAWIKIRRKS